MLHHNRYDDLERLLAELDHERRHRETIDWSNAELERSISELSVYLQELDASSRTTDDNEWRVRFESQTALNKQLEEHKNFLEAELVEARRRLTTGTYPEAMNFNLDALNEPELLRLVKHLERMRNDFYNALRDAEWKFDKETKEFHHFDEMRRVYRGDLKHANHLVERMRMGMVYDPELGPVYPAGYYNRYLDGGPHPVYKGGKEGKKKDKKGNKNPKEKTSGGQKNSGGTGGGEGENPQESPSRSKSRQEKRSKSKKEAPPEEPQKRSNSPSRGSRKGAAGPMTNNVTNNGKDTARGPTKASEAEGGHLTDNSSPKVEKEDVREKESMPASGETFTVAPEEPETKEKEADKA